MRIFCVTKDTLGAVNITREDKVSQTGHSCGLAQSLIRSIDSKGPQFAHSYSYKGIKVS
jgi:hypothetical protein